MNSLAPENQEMVSRKLDGCYFRVQRNGKYENLCFTDLTEKERASVIADWSAPQLKNMCNYLASRIRKIGDELDIVCD